MNYNYEMDPELQKLIDAKMQRDGVIPELQMPEMGMPAPQEPGFDIPQLELGNMQPDPNIIPDVPTRDQELERLRENLMERMQNKQSEQDTYEASKAAAGAAAGPSGFQKGAGMFAAALQGMASGGKDLSASSKLKKGWDADTKAAMGKVVDPSVSRKEQLNEYLQMKALQKGDKAFGQQKELKQMGLDEARERTKEGQDFQRSLMKEKAGIASSALDKKSELDEKKRLAKGSVGEQEVDKKFAKDLNDWQTRGLGTYNKNIERLKRSRDLLKKRKDDLVGTSGRFTGRMPDFLRSEESIGLREDVHASAQGALRATLGSQFTEKEGERIMKASYNENLSPDENIKRIDDAIKELETNAYNMDSRGEFFRENQGTLRGWEPSEAPKKEVQKEIRTKMVNGVPVKYEKTDGGWKRVR